MSRGHHFTHCQYCNREYVCGDCITSDCELGHNRKRCEHYQAHIGQQKAQAHLMEKLFDNPDKKKAGVARMLAGMNWDSVCESLSNGELAEELKIKVWAEQTLGTYEIALIEQAIERLNKKDTK
jgi:hypothetical protein